MSTPPVTQPAAPGAGTRPAAMGFILVAVLIDMISVGLIIPVLPALVGTFTVGPADQAFWYGAVSLAFAVATFFSSPVLGGLSDRFGRRPVLLIGFLGLALSFFATALSTALWMLVAARAIAGATQANAAVAQAYVADVSAPDERARRFGLIGAMFGVGYTLGPVMGGVLGDISLHLPFYVAGALALLNAAYGAFVLPESLPREHRQPFRWAKANPVAALHGLTQLRGVGALVWVIGLAGLAQFTMHMSWVLYTTFKFGWGPKENGWSLFAVGVMAALVQGGLMKALLKRFSPRRLAAMGLVSSTFCYLAWGLATEGWMMIVIVGLNLFGFTSVAALQSLISNAADDRDQGRTMGAVASLNSLTGVIAPVIASGLLTLVSDRGPGDPWLGLPFFFCAVLQGMAAFVAIRHFQRRRDRATAAPVAP